MAHLRKLALVAVLVLAAVMSIQRKGTVRRVDEIPERLRGSWYLANPTVAGPRQVHAFRLEPTQVVLLDATTGAASRSQPTRQISIVTRLNPRRGYAVIYFGTPHPTNIAEDRMEVYFDPSDAISVKKLGGSSDWPDSARFVRR
jgi:hypothetical protein